MQFVVALACVLFQPIPPEAELWRTLLYSIVKACRSLPSSCVNGHALDRIRTSCMENTWSFIMSPKTRGTVCARPSFRGLVVRLIQHTTHMHARTHARTHARMHARMHTHTHTR